MAINKKSVLDKLGKVLDPELCISIVDLGLIYKVSISKNNKVKILMTLTTIGCPLFPMIEQQIKNTLKPLGIVENNITVELVFDPPWNMDKMSEKGKVMLGI